MNRASRMVGVLIIIAVLTGGNIAKGESTNTLIPDIIVKLIEKIPHYDEINERLLGYGKVNGAVEKFIKSASSRDETTIRDLLSPNAIGKVDHFEERLHDLYDCVDGDLVDCKRLWAGQDHKERHDGKTIVIHYTPYEFSTTTGDYYIAVKYVERDDFEKGNEGFEQIFIIRKDCLSEDDGIYFGGLVVGCPYDGVPGIFINVPEHPSVLQ